MPLYVTPEYPERLLKVKSSNRRDSLFEAVQQIVSLIDEGYFDRESFRNFSPKYLIEIKKSDLMPDNKEKITEAVKILAKLSNSRQKIQELRDQAIEASEQVDLLFADKKISENDFKSINKSLRIVEKYAIEAFAYKQAFIKAKEAHSVLKEVLTEPELTQGEN